MFKWLNKIRLKGLSAKTDTNVLVVDDNGDIGINTSVGEDLTGDLTVTGGDIILGAANGTASTIKRLSNVSGSAGASFYIYGANAVGTNIAGGSIANFGGLGTGTGNPGAHLWYGSAKTGSGSSAQSYAASMLLQHDYTGIGVSTLRLYSGLNMNDWFAIDVAAEGATTISTVDAGTTVADLTLDADGNIKLEPATGKNILLDGTLTVDAGVVIPVATAHDAAGTAISIGAGATTAGTTNNIAGGTLTIHGGQGKGSGAGGEIVFKTANAGSSGSTLNSLATALTISDDLGATFAGTIRGDLTGNVAGNVEGNVTGNVEGNLTGTVLTATQASITSAANLVTVGTIGTGVWQGTAVASAYLDADTMHYSAQRQLTHHTIKDDIGTGVVYISLGELDAESGSVSNKNLPLLAPVAGKLLKIFVRTAIDMSGVDLTWRLYTRAASATTGGNAAVIGTSAAVAGPTNSSMVTYDFTSVDTNAILAGDKVQISVQADGASADTLFFITCLWEWNLS